MVGFVVWASTPIFFYSGRKTYTNGIACYEGNPSLLGVNLRNLSGLTENGTFPDGVYIVYKGLRDKKSLTSLNDAGATFEEISYVLKELYYDEDEGI